MAKLGKWGDAKLSDLLLVMFLDIFFPKTSPGCVREGLQKIKGEDKVIYSLATKIPI